MGKVNYIKDKEGKLAGSYKGPVAPAALPPRLPGVPPAKGQSDEKTPGFEETYAKFAKSKMDDATAWIENAPFSTLNAIKSDDYVLLSDYTIEDSEYAVGDRLKRSLVKRETAELFLRAEEVSREDIAPGVYVSVVRYPAYLSPDGSCPATRSHIGDLVSSQQKGIVTIEGEFISNPDSFSEIFKERLGEPGCPLYDEMEGYPTDWQIRTVNTRDLRVLGLHLNISCDEVEIDPDDLVDPDAAWDSRFD